MMAFLRAQYFRVLQRQRDSRYARRGDHRDRWLVDTLEPRVMLSATASAERSGESRHESTTTVSNGVSQQIDNGTILSAEGTVKSETVKTQYTL